MGNLVGSWNVYRYLDQKVGFFRRGEFTHGYAEGLVMSKHNLIEKTGFEGGAWRWWVGAITALVVLLALESWARDQLGATVQTPGQVLGVVRLAQEQQKPRLADTGSKAQPTKVARKNTIPDRTSPTRMPSPLESSSLEKTQTPHADKNKAMDTNQDKIAATPSSAKIVTPRQLDAGFRQLKGTSPRYPTGARRAGVPGEVRMELEINPAGQVERVEIMGETGGWGFGDAVRRAYLAARFSPPTMAGEPVRVRWRQTLRFTP